MPEYRRVKTTIRHVRLALLATCIGLGVACRPAPNTADGMVTTLSVKSPSARYLLEILENDSQLDRNFVVFLTDTQVTSPRRLIFTSPDETRPPSERVIWSSNELGFLLVSSNNMVEPRARLAAGGELYLLYSIKHWKLWCNASQAEVENFGLDEVARLGIRLP